MQHTKPITLAAVAAALMLSGGAHAATDDMGMQYTSASEGLSGSFRVNLYHTSDADELTDAGAIVNSDTAKGASLDSLRLYFNGTADLGNGLSSSYGLELRAAGGTCGDNQCTKTQAYHVGLNGAFGSLQFGRIAGAAFMVPGGSLDSLMGNSRKTPSSDPGDQTFKFTSPNINGLQFGFSAKLDDKGDITATPTSRYNGSTVNVSDDLLDEVSFAAVYDTPLGLKLGAAYEKAAKTNNASYLDDITGYRFGAHYGQDNWKVAYEYRQYDNFASVDTGSLSDLVGDGKTGNDYSVHGFGVQFSLDKVIASANYSVEEAAFDNLADSRHSASDPIKDIKRTKLGVDVKYALGGKSAVLLGFSTEEQEVWDPTDLRKLGPSLDTDITTLRYQVDF